MVPRLFEPDNVYVFQNRDGRLIFASPYERDFTLLGSAGHAFTGDPAIVAMTANDVAYLCDAANRYFRRPVEPVDVVRTVSGVNLSPARGGVGVASVPAPRQIGPDVTHNCPTRTPLLASIMRPKCLTSN